MSSIDVRDIKTVRGISTLPRVGIVCSHMRYLPEDIVNYASVVTYNSSKEEDYPSDLVKGKIFCACGGKSCRVQFHGVDEDGSILATCDWKWTPMRINSIKCDRACRNMSFREEWPKLLKRANRFKTETKKD